MITVTMAALEMPGNAGSTFVATPLYEDAVAHGNLFGFLGRKRARFYEGHCVEVGNFDDLSSRGGYFARLLAAQQSSGVAKVTSTPMV